jgi:hypothetical protein
MDDLIDLQDIEYEYSLHKTPIVKSIYFRTNPIDIYPDKHFKMRYRMSKQRVYDLLNLIINDLSGNDFDGKGCPFSPLTLLLIGLRFYAT